MMAGSDGTPLSLADWPVTFPCSAARRSSSSRVRDGGVYIDGTFGAGGYTRAILDAADCTRHRHRPRPERDRGRR